MRPAGWAPGQLTVRNRSFYPCVSLPLASALLSVIRVCAALQRSNTNRVAKLPKKLDKYINI